MVWREGEEEREEAESRYAGRGQLVPWLGARVDQFPGGCFHTSMPLHRLSLHLELCSFRSFSLPRWRLALRAFSSAGACSLESPLLSFPRF